MSDETIEWKDKGFKNLLEAILNENQHKVKVGILGKSPQRSSKTTHSPTNAEIGMRHEFGLGVRQRSFLRTPLIDNMQAGIDASGAFDEAVALQVLKTAKIIPWLDKLGAVALGVVLEGFATGGYGKWPAWKDPKYESNTGQLLMDTTQLRDSITWDVI